MGYLQLIYNIMSTIIPIQSNNTPGYTKGYTKGDPKKLPTDSLDCAICYDKIHPDNYSITKCSHMFCTSCIEAWLCVNQTCPLCRMHIPITSAIPRQSAPISISDPILRDVMPRRRQTVINNIGMGAQLEQFFDIANNITNPVDSTLWFNPTHIGSGHFANADFGNDDLANSMAGF